MAKSANQKKKLLVLRQLLLTRTDEEHPLTIREIIAFLYNNPVDGKIYIDDPMRERMEAYLGEYGGR